MNRVILSGVALFFAMVGIALLGGQKEAAAGHGCNGCHGVVACDGVGHGCATTCKGRCFGRLRQALRCGCRGRLFARRCAGHTHNCCGPVNHCCGQPTCCQPVDCCGNAVMESAPVEEGAPTEVEAPADPGGEAPAAEGAK